MGCLDNTECQTTLGDRGFCKDGSCACLPYHHLYDKYCIKNRGKYRKNDMYVHYVSMNLPIMYFNSFVLIY